MRLVVRKHFNYSICVEQRYISTSPLTTKSLKFKIFPVRRLVDGTIENL